MNNSTQHKTDRKPEVWDSDSSDGAGRTKQRREKAKRKPVGGGKCLYMDPKEVKACRELGFELENDDDYYNHDQEKKEHHEEMDYYNNLPLRKIITKRSSLSRQYSSTSSSTGDNTPIQNWRISSPGDDPQDVKARLKVWAQAVALKSTSQLQN